jgi:hypothetical protein
MSVPKCCLLFPAGKLRNPTALRPARPFAWSCHRLSSLFLLLIKGAFPAARRASRHWVVYSSSFRCEYCSKYPARQGWSNKDNTPFVALLNQRGSVTDFFHFFRVYLMAGDMSHIPGVPNKAANKKHRSNALSTARTAGRRFPPATRSSASRRRPRIFLRLSPIPRVNAPAWPPRRTRWRMPRSPGW